MPHLQNDIIDPAAILATLGNCPDATCAPLTGGIDARMWRVDTGHQRYALRLLTPSQQTQMQREIAIANWAQQHDFPVPGIIATGMWQNRPVSLIEWAEGRQIGEEILTASDPESIARQLGVEFGRMQARLHALPPPTDPVITARDWRTWTATSEALASHLNALSPVQECLIHLDFHPLNVLAQNGRITAVLDWANAHTGDPRTDLARTQSILQLAALPNEAAVKAVSTFETAWQKGYTEIAGSFDIPPVFQWWAGEAMEQDLLPHIGHPDAPWLTPAHLDRVRTWTATARQNVSSA